jgi:hypothetical protein
MMDGPGVVGGGRGEDVMSKLIKREIAIVHRIGR